MKVKIDHANFILLFRYKLCMGRHVHLKGGIVLVTN